MAELAYQTWKRITGKSWSEAKKLGLTDGSAAGNTALQKKLLSGWRPGQPEAGAAPAAAPADPMESYRRMITDWYSAKPATPGAFQYSPEQEAADKRSVGDQYRPFYQEQAAQSGQDFKVALDNARAGFSRRGLWGAAAGTTQVTDPNTGITATTAGAAPTAAGPVSGIRQVGEQRINEANNRTNTAYNRAYTEAVAGGVQNRRNEAYDVYSKTIRQPYEDQYRTWLASLNALTAGTR